MSNININYIYKFSDNSYMLTKEQATALYNELVERRNNGEYISYDKDDIRFLYGTAKVTITERERTLVPDRDDMTYEQRQANYIHRDMIEMMLKGVITPILKNGKPVAYREKYTEVSISNLAHSATNPPNDYTTELFDRALNGRAIEHDVTGCSRMGLPLDNPCVMTTRIADVDISGCELVTYAYRLCDYWGCHINEDKIIRNHNYKIGIEVVVYTNLDGTPRLDEDHPVKPKVWRVYIWDIDDANDNSEYKEWLNQPLIDKVKEAENHNSYGDYYINWKNENVPSEVYDKTYAEYEEWFEDEYDMHIEDDEDFDNDCGEYSEFLSYIYDNGFKLDNGEIIYPLTYHEWLKSQIA